MRKFMVFIFIITFGSAVHSAAQECGPGCPICSGSGSSTGAILPSGTLVFSAMSIPTGEDETAVFNLRAGVTAWLDVGLGYTLKSDRLIWSVRWQPLVEDESSWRPGVILGTGSVQTGKSDQSVFVQLTKAFEFSEKISARFSIGAASLLPKMNRGYFLTNITMTIDESWSPFLSFDGLNFHLGLSWIPTDWLFIACLMVETKFPAILVGYRFYLQ
ncbi:MAG: hypothetical protein L6425_09720 [Candidatus Aminicenantes bacterium]|nr:hypothetical protein [Acidobacteriota bacterium]MCG2816194.1 hypothetical protein [Candidatus Aminicenantes bacterium]